MMLALGVSVGYNHRVSVAYNHRVSVAYNHRVSITYNHRVSVAYITIGLVSLITIGGNPFHFQSLSFQILLFVQRNKLIYTCHMYDCLSRYQCHSDFK